MSRLVVLSLVLALGAVFAPQVDVVGTLGLRNPVITHARESSWPDSRYAYDGHGATAGGGVLGGAFGGIRSIPLIRGAEPAVDATRSGVGGLSRAGSAAKIDPHHAFPPISSTTSRREARGS